MSTTFLQDTIFNAKTEALVNTVNCVGVMGKGLALACKVQYDRQEHLMPYLALCSSGTLKPGVVDSFVRTTHHALPKVVIYFPTKDHWRSPSKLEWIQSGLVSMNNLCIQNSIKSVALPRIGCGNGGLHWPTVRLMIQDILTTSEVNYFIYE